jgi:hypothetical protein
MINSSDKSCRENQTHFIFSNCFRNSCRLWDTVGKCGTSEHDIDDNIIRWFPNVVYITYALCIQHVYSTDTLRIFNTHCFLMGKIVTWTRLDVTFVSTLPVFPDLGILCYSILICLPQQTTIISCMNRMQTRLICRHSLSITSQKPRNPKSCLRAVRQMRLSCIIFS